MSRMHSGTDILSPFVKDTVKYSEFIQINSVTSGNQLRSKSSQQLISIDDRAGTKNQEPEEGEETPRNETAVRRVSRSVRGDVEDELLRYQLNYRWQVKRAGGSASRQ